MNAKLLAAAAAAVSLAAAAAAHASPDRDLKAFLDDAYGQAQAQLSGVDLNQHSVKAQAYVDAEGRLTSVRAVDSAGSRDTADRVAAALKQVRVHYVPPGLVGAQVNLAFGAAETQAAKGR